MKRLGLILLLLLIGCVDVNVPDSLLPEIKLPPILGSPTPQPAPTPVGDILEFVIPQPRANYSLAPNQRIPGSQLEFVSKQDGVFSVRIDGFEAQKQDGDTFPWRGVIAPGVLANYDLRLLPTFRDDSLTANGSVGLTVFDPQPVEQLIPANGSDALIFENIAIDYLVPIGRTIPGTTLLFDSEANGFAEFSGTSGLPRYAINDTLRWGGAIRPNVFIQYDVQLIGLEVNGLRIRGTATLTIQAASATP